MIRSKIAAGVWLALGVVDLFGASGCEMPGHHESSDRHLLLLVEHGPSGFHVDEVHVVASPLPRSRAPRALRWRVVVVDGVGQALYSDSIPESGIRRGVFVNAEGTTESVQTRRETFSFALRLPFVENAVGVRFLDTDPGEPSGTLALAPSEVELGAIPYPTDVP
jgi:hypothetical protein